MTGVVTWVRKYWLLILIVLVVVFLAKKYL